MALTGDQYLQSLRDGREVWLEGRRVDSVPDHPALGGAARTLASLYDSLHDPAQAKVLTWTTPTGSTSHKAFRVARTRRHLQERVAAMQVWARMHYGFLGRSPDYKGGLAVSLGANPAFFGDFADNAQRWYAAMADDVLFLNHIGVNPMVDRSKATHELPDVNVRVVAERDDGFVVRGAKMIGTSAAFTHCNLVFSAAPVPLDDRDAAHALVFFVRTGAPGMKLICRTSYEGQVRGRSPFDYPLSSRFDENDATVVFDDVFIPWEDCLVYRDPQLANEFFVKAQVVQNLMLHGAVRFATKMEFMTGLLLRLCKQAGNDSFRGVGVKLGEIVGYTWMFGALVRDACASPDPGPNGTVAPSHRTIFAARALAPAIYPRIREAFQLLGAGGLMQLPSGAQDLVSEELRPYLDLYYRGTGVDAVDRIKTWKLAWDAIGSEFGSRQELFERNFAGSFDNVRLENLFLAERNGDVPAWGGLVDDAMSAYDEHGWVSAPWATPAPARRTGSDDS
jgi:4-hydroxyphenylacetate 3-monooxygenase